MDNKELLDSMRQRLAAKLEEKNIPMRTAGVNAGLGMSYVSGILKEGKDPQVTKLAKLCDANGISLTWVLYGIDITPESEKLLKLFESEPEKRDSILALLSQGSQL